MFWLVVNICLAASSSTLHSAISHLAFDWRVANLLVQNGLSALFLALLVSWLRYLTGFPIWTLEPKTPFYKNGTPTRQIHTLSLLLDSMRPCATPCYEWLPAARHNTTIVQERRPLAALRDDLLLVLKQVTGIMMGGTLKLWLQEGVLMCFECALALKCFDPGFCRSWVYVARSDRVMWCYLHNRRRSLRG